MPRAPDIESGADSQLEHAMEFGDCVAEELADRVHLMANLLRLRLLASLRVPNQKA